MSGQRPDEHLRSERLYLVPVTADDADTLSEVFLDNRLYAFTGGEPGTLEELRATFAHLAAGRSTSRFAQRNWVVRHQVDGKAIGMLQAIFSGGGHAAEIAWVVGLPWQGQGMAIEAARAVVGWLLGQGVQTITAWIRPDHHASAAVACRAGLTATDEYRDTELHREQLWRLQPSRGEQARGDDAVEERAASVRASLDRDVSTL